MIGKLEKQSVPVVTLIVRTARIQKAPWLFMLPALVVFALFFVVPAVNLLLLSLSPSGSLDVVLNKSGLGNYIRIVSDSFYLDVLWRTIRIALITVLLCLLMGYPLAYYMAHSTGRKRAYVTLLVVSPLLLSLLVRSLGWIVVLGPNGLVNWILGMLGLADTSINLLFSETAVVIGLTHVFLAFMVLAVAASLQNIDPALPLAAQSLGATRFRAFMVITLPLSLPGVIAGSLLVFTLSSSAFVLPVLLGGSYNKVMSYLVWQYALVLLNWPMAAAVAFVLMFAIGVLVFVYLRLVQSQRFSGVFS